MKQKYTHQIKILTISGEGRKGVIFWGVVLFADHFIFSQK